MQIEFRVKVKKKKSSDKNLSGKKKNTTHLIENRMVKALKIVSSVHSFVTDFLFELDCLLSVCSQSPFVMQK